MSVLATKLTKYHEHLSELDPLRLIGRVTRVTGLLIESIGPTASVGEICYIYSQPEQPPVLSEVVGFKDESVMLLMPLAELDGIGPGSEVVASGHPFMIRVGSELLGRVLGGTGEPIDGKGRLGACEERSILSAPPGALSRRNIREPLATGVKAIDGLLTCGKGQRVGIFSGSGLGKSVLLGQIARCSSADVNVIALIGERAREAREFLEGNLGEEGLKKSVVVVVPSHEFCLLRVKGALIATTIAEYFRDQGQDVLLMMDSVTRYARAQRELSLSLGDPPATRGYPPTVFANLPRLLERSGMGVEGSITGLYTVLVEGDDMDEPVADNVRAILDGHVVLSRKLANRGHFPAIDVLGSVSRAMIDVVAPEHRAAARKCRIALSVYNEAEDLIKVGAYEKGNDPNLDRAIELYPNIVSFLMQEVREYVGFDDIVAQLGALV